MYKIWLFCQLIFFVAFFSLSEAHLKLSVLYLLGYVTVGSLYLSVAWYITYDTGNERWQVTESEKIMCLGPHWFMLQLLSFCVHLLFFSFRDELGLVESLSTLGFFNNLLNEAGCWVKYSLSSRFPNRDYLILVWKSCPPTFRKRQLLSLTWVSIPFISCLFYCFTLFLIFNNGTFFGVACTSLFNIFKLQPRVVETRL